MYRDPDVIIVVVVVVAAAAAVRVHNTIYYHNNTSDRLLFVRSRARVKPPTGAIPGQRTAAVQLVGHLHIYYITIIIIL